MDQKFMGREGEGREGEMGSGRVVVVSGEYGNGMAVGWQWVQESILQHPYYKIAIAGLLQCLHFICLVNALPVSLLYIPIYIPIYILHTYLPKYQTPLVLDN